LEEAEFERLARGCVVSVDVKRFDMRSEERGIFMEIHNFNLLRNSNAASRVRRFLGVGSLGGLNDPVKYMMLEPVGISLDEFVRRAREERIEIPLWLVTAWMWIVADAVNKMQEVGFHYMDIKAEHFKVRK